MYNQNFYYPPVSPMGFASGGNVASQQRYGLAAAAEQLRQRGRGGDTILAHINPEEAKILKALGGSGTINPRTGLPEYGISLKNLNPVKIVKDVAKSAEKAVIRPIGGALEKVGSQIDDAVIQPVITAVKDVGSAVDDVVNDIVPGGWGTVAAAAAMYMGMPQGLSSLSPASFVPAAGEAGIGAGIEGLGYDIGAFGGASGAAAGAAEVLPVAPWAEQNILNQIPAAVTPVPTAASAPTELFNVVGEAGLPTMQASNVVTGAEAADINALLQGAGGESYIPTSDVGGDFLSSGVESIDAAVGGAPDITGPVSTGGMSGLGSLGSTIGGAGKAALDYAKGLTMKDVKDAAQLGTVGMTGYGMLTAAQESKEQKEAAQQALNAAEAKKAEQRTFAENVLRENTPRYGRLTAEDVRRYGLASGGIASSFDDEIGRDYARGGIAALPPRYLSGGGDGMSDSIRARIGGKQEARLADGEFVVPADIVSHLGNGSSNAGAKKLYAMMDRVRKARTGKTRQAPAVNTDKLLPA